MRVWFLCVCLVLRCVFGLFGFEGLFALFFMAVTDLKVKPKVSFAKPFRHRVAMLLQMLVHQCLRVAHMLCRVPTGKFGGLGGHPFCKIYTTIKNKGQLNSFFWQAFWAPRVATPKINNTGCGLYIFAGPSQKRWDKQYHWTFGRFAHPEKLPQMLNSRPGHCRRTPSLQKRGVGAIALPTGSPKTPGKASRRQNGLFAPPSITLSPLPLLPCGSYRLNPEF